MPTVLTMHLVRPNMTADVRHNVLLNGAPTGQPGVTAIVVHAQGQGWCVLADHPDNPGVSVTNGAALYAQAVCRVLDREPRELAWYEVDSDGYFDELLMLGPSVGYAPLLEDGCAPRTMAAFVARAGKLPAGLPGEAEDWLNRCLAPFAR